VAYSFRVPVWKPTRSVLEELWTDPGRLRAQLELTQAEMARALGVTSNAWARWERGTLAIHPAYQLLLNLVEHKADRDADRVAAQLRQPGGVRNLW
jgi:transcriptional regulator with XRE-family HTH domain